jgi:hypothetical protein
VWRDSRLLPQSFFFNPDSKLSKTEQRLIAGTALAAYRNRFPCPSRSAPSIRTLAPAVAQPRHDHRCHRQHKNNIASAAASAADLIRQNTVINAVQMPPRKRVFRAAIPMVEGMTRVIMLLGR